MVLYVNKVLPECKYIGFISYTHPFIIKNPIKGSKFFRMYLNITPKDIFLPYLSFEIHHQLGNYVYKKLLESYTKNAYMYIYNKKYY